MAAKKNNKKSEFGTIISPFYQIGQATYRFIKKINIVEGYFTKVGDKLETIYPKYKREDILENYFSYKFMSVYAFLFAGILLIVVYIAAFTDNNKISELQRNDYWGIDNTSQIIAKSDNKEETLDITVSHQQLSEETMKELIQKKTEQLPNLILGENESIDNIVSDLELISEIPETQINVYWTLEENDVLLSDGTLVEENIAEEGNIVKLMATVSYEDIIVDTEFYVNIKPRNLSEKEKFFSEIMKKIEQADKDSVEKEELVLPQKVNGKNISYFVPKEDDKRGLVIILFVVGICLLFFVQDEKLEKQKEKREAQMMMDYPEIINKLVIYLGAGLTIQGAFEMIAENYLHDRIKRKDYKRFAYEEIVYLCREIQNGISFRNALEHFSVRCNVMPFRKLSMLLQQNLKKGSNELLSLLRNESVSAFETRKNIAKKMGEEAGTKILMPMLMMLGVVLIILIVPACMSFQI